MDLVAALGRALLADERLVDVRDDTTTGDGGLDERVELLVATDGELEVARCDALDLEVLGRVTGKLEHLGGEVLENGSRVDSGGGTDAAVRCGALLEVTVDPAHGKLRADKEGGEALGDENLAIEIFRGRGITARSVNWMNEHSRRGEGGSSSSSGSSSAPGARRG